MRSAVPRLTSMLLAVGFTFGTGASYDKTKWGMPAAQVEKLYPGGVAQQQQNGETTYGVVRPIRGFSTAFITFTFAPGGGLKNVVILFPVQGTKVNLSTGIYTATTKEGAEEIRKSLRTSLIAKYGSPVLTDDESDSWFSSDGDYIYLSLTNASHDPNHATAALLYKPPQRQDAGDL